MKKLLALMLVLSMVLGLAACGTGSPSASSEAAPAESAAEATEEKTEEAAPAAASSDDVFRIGVFVQLTGGIAVAGQNALNGIQLAAKEINEQGGFNGQQVEIKYYDTTGSTEEAVKVVQKMLADDDVDAIIGSVNSNEVSACIKDINAAKVYNFGLGTSPAWMEDQSMIYTFRASSNNGRIAPFSVDVVKDVMGYSTVAIMNGTDDTGASTADAFEAACKEKGVTVTTRQQCDTEDTDFSGQITQIIASDPDTIFMSLIGATFGPFVKQLRNMGYKGTILCKECFSQEYQDVANEGSPADMRNADYIYFAYPYVAYESIDDCDIPNVKEFLQKYYDEYGEMVMHESAYRGWDTMQVMWEASKIAGANDSESLREATHKVQIEGMGGKLDYTDGSREGYSEFKSFMLVGGKNYDLATWMSDGSYDAYKEVTGRDR
jgi:branched-chain amino acid transport system substrate-binding protein